MSRASRGLRLTGKLIKGLFFTLIFSIIALLLWRMFSSGDPKSMRTLTVNDGLYAAYEQKGESLTLFRQTQNTITYAEHNYGFFAVTDCIFIPDANQIQLVFRYNNAAIRDLMEKYELQETPDRSDELYDVTLLLATDLTPDVSDDNLGNDPESVAFTRLHPTAMTEDHRNLYNYRRFVFDLGDADLSLSELVGENGNLLAIYTDIYYVGDVNYDETSYGTLCIYDYVQPKEDAELTSRDRRALRDYRED